MAKTEYEVRVNFTVTYTTDVRASNQEEAREKAEHYLTEEFRKELDTGYLGVSDFVYESEIVRQ